MFKITSARYQDRACTTTMQALRMGECPDAINYNALDTWLPVRVWGRCCPFVDSLMHSGLGFFLCELHLRNQ